MSDRLTLGVTGGEELIAKIARLTDAMADTALEEAAFAGAAPILTAAVDNVPVKSGLLKSSLTAEITAADRTHAVVAIGTEGVHYAGFVEFGHATPRGAHVPAHPFLRPAFDTEAPAAADEVANDLRDRLEQAAA